MTESTSSANLNKLDADMFKELRDSARVYQKLDFAYLAAFGAIATALKLNHHALMDFTAQLWAVLIGLLVLLTIDTIIEQFFFRNWIAAKTNISLNCKASTAIKIIKFQPFLHHTFICLCVIGFLGYSSGVTNFMDEKRAQSQIQEATDSFILNYGYPPASIEDLAKLIPYAAQSHASLNGMLTRFEAIGEKSYQIIFAGNDNELDTSDDVIVTSEVKIREILTEIEKK